MTITKELLSFDPKFHLDIMRNACTPHFQTSASLSISKICLQAPIYRLPSRISPDGLSWQFDPYTHHVTHLGGTAWLGVGENIVLAGNALTQDQKPSVFAKLNQLNLYDMIAVEQYGALFYYTVKKIKRYDYEDLSFIASVCNCLTLVAHFGEPEPDAYFEPRLVVIADAV